MFTNPFPNAFGLDIGDLSIKVVQLRNASNILGKPSYELVTARGIAIPRGLIVNGELIQPEQVRHYIQKLLQGRSKQEKKIVSPWVVASLPETHGFIKMITLPKVVDEIIPDDILIEAQKHIPFTEQDQYYLDWQILPATSKSMSTSVLIAAIPRQIADSYTYLLESLGLGVMALEIEGVAISRAMITAQKQYQNEARAILDIGATRSSMIVYDHDCIQFSSTLPFSGELITTAIAQHMKLSYEEAEALKIKQGLEFEKKQKSWKACIDVAKDFADHIRKDMLFYYSHFPGSQRITHITMCGGGSSLIHLDKFLSLELKTECRTGLVWKNLMSKHTIPFATNTSLGYATAIGLALRAADNPHLTKDTI